MRRVLPPFLLARRNVLVLIGASLLGGLVLAMSPELGFSRSGSEAPEPVAAPQSSPALALLPTDAGLPRSDDGRHYPLLPRDGKDLAALLVALEEADRKSVV